MRLGPAAGDWRGQVYEPSQRILVRSPWLLEGSREKFSQTGYTFHCYLYNTIFALFENRPYIAANPVVTDYMWEQHSINKAQKLKVQR